MRDERKEALVEIIWILTITTIVYVCIRFLLPLVFPFLVSLLFAKILYPIIQKMYRTLKWKKSVLTIAVVAFFFVFFLTIAWFVFENLFGQIRELLGNTKLYQEKAVVFWDGCCMQMQEWTGISAQSIDGEVKKVVPFLWSQVKNTMLPSLMTESMSWVKTIGTFLGICIVVLVSTFLLLKDYEKLHQILYKNVLGRSLVRVSRGVYRAGGAYLKAQLMIMLLVIAVCSMGLFFVGNSYALLVGIGIGICDALPFLGTGTVFLPWALIKMLQGEYRLAVCYIFIYSIASMVREIIEPRLVGNKLGMHPLMVLLSAYVGLKLYGLSGVLLGPFTFILVREIRKEIKGKAGLDNPKFVE